MMKTIVTILAVLILMSCAGGDRVITPESDGEVASASQIEQIGDSSRVFAGGTYELPVHVIASEIGYQEFIRDMENTNQWNEDIPFWREFKAASVDFDEYNIILYPLSEGSGSNTVSPQAAQISGDSAHVNIVRIVPNVGTDDIAVYLLIYKVNKSITSIFFDNGFSNREYLNQEGEYLKPYNCQDLDYCKDQASEAVTVELIKTPLLEHGYSNFNTIVLDNSTTFERFLEGVKAQDAWNNKQEFLDVLSNVDVDFEMYNVVLFRHTEGSLSNVVRLGESSIGIDRVSVKILRDVPDAGDAAIANYAFVYKIKKEIAFLEFSVSGRETSVIANIAGENIAPLNCKVWNDGCNDCIRGENGSVGCTKKSCSVYGSLNCKEWE